MFPIQAILVSVTTLKIDLRWKWILQLYHLLLHKLVSFSLKYPAILDKHSLLKNNSCSSKALLLNSGREGIFCGFSKAKWRKKKKKAKIKAETWTSLEGWEASCRSKQGKSHRLPEVLLASVLFWLPPGWGRSSGGDLEGAGVPWWGLLLFIGGSLKLLRNWVRISMRCCRSVVAPSVCKTCLKREKEKGKKSCMWGQNGCHLPYKMFLLHGEGEAAHAFGKSLKLPGLGSDVLRGSLD